MSSSNGAAPSPLGECDDEDLDDLDDAMARINRAEEERVNARARAAMVMGRMLGRGAQRKAIAERAKVSNQTVSNIVFGIPPKTPAKKDG